MEILLDTNIMLRWANEDDPEYDVTLTAIEEMSILGNSLRSTPQSLVEFWIVATRPISVNGLGLTTTETETLVERLMVLFPLLPDTSDIFPEWLNLVSAAKVSGRQVHDARLVAVMLAHGVDSILTFDTDDFKRYREFGITPVHPTSV